MESQLVDSIDDPQVLRAIIAAQAAKLVAHQAEIGKRNSIIDILKAQLHLAHATASTARRPRRSIVRSSNMS